MPVVPPNGNFKYCFSIQSSIHIKQHVFTCDEHDQARLYVGKLGTLLPFSGSASLQIGKTLAESIPVYVENHFKSEKYFLWFKSLEDLNAYKLFLEPPAQTRAEKVEIYTFNSMGGWVLSKTCVDLSLDQYVGYQHYYHKIVRQITDWQENQEKLNKINLQSGINMMLYGVPGSG